MPNGITDPVVLLSQGQSPMANGLHTSLMPVQAQQLMPAPQPDANLPQQQLSITSAVQVVALPTEDQPPSDILKAQAQTLKVSCSQACSS